MGPTRRRFIETAATLAGLGVWGCATGGGSPGSRRLVGAPGVELNVDRNGLPDYSRDLQRYLARLAGDAFQQRKKLVDSVSSAAAVADRQKTIVAELWKMLGGPFEKTALNPRVTGTVQRQAYRIEKVAFESRPRLFVTANLYVPNGGGRRPAILAPLGHSTTGKAWPSYQKLFSNLARKGYVVLTYDPFGQGERIEYPGARPGLTSLGSGGTTEHEYAGRRLILLGANFGLFRVWDGIRGVDYLLSRPEVDPDRIGCCGQSGGGTLTQFLAALEPRIQAAVVSEGNTENLAHSDVEPPGSADDAEQNIVPAAAHGIDRADLLYAFAPKPLLMTVTLHDAGHTYSPEYVASGRDLLDEYRKAYGVLDASDRVALQVTTEAHGYVYEMRRATYAWFNRWFKVRADDEEGEQSIEPDEALYVTSTGFVATSIGGETALSLTRQMADGVKASRASTAEDVQRRIRSVLGVDPLPAAAPLTRMLAIIQKRGYRAEQFEIPTEAEIRAPGWLLTPDGAGPSSPLVLYLGEGSAWGAVAEDGLLEKLCKGGRRVAVMDVRGRGDCAIAYPERGRFYFANRITNEAYLHWFTLMLGRPLLGGQVFDTLRAVQYFRTLGTGSISIVGDGPHGVVALYAGALDASVRGVVLRQVVTDYRTLATAERYSQPFGIYAYGVLRQFDLPDVAGALAPRPVLIVNPTNAMGETSIDAAQALYREASNVRVHPANAGADAMQRLIASF